MINSSFDFAKDNGLKNYTEEIFVVELKIELEPVENDLSRRSVSCDSNSSNSTIQCAVYEMIFC